MTLIFTGDTMGQKWLPPHIRICCPFPLSPLYSGPINIEVLWCCTWAPS